VQRRGASSARVPGGATSAASAEVAAGDSVGWRPPT
jgi:hypothetical protein